MEKKFFELEIPDCKDQALRAAINGTEIYNQAIRIHLIGALEEGKTSTFRETQLFLRNIFSTQLYLPPESLSSRKSHSFIGPPNTEDHNKQPQSNDDLHFSLIGARLAFSRILERSKTNLSD